MFSRLKQSKLTLFIITTLLVGGWVLSGWPQIWSSPDIPPQPQIASAATTSTYYAGSAADGADGNDCIWSNPSNATGDTTGSSANCSFGGNNKFTNFLYLTNFGFTSDDIPSGSTIDGVVAEVEWSGGSSIIDTTVQLTKDGTTLVGDDKSISSNQTTKQFRTYGGSADDWNASLTQSDVTSSSFGLGLQYQKNSGGPPENADVYRVRITIYYTPSVSFEQSGYRFFENNDGTDVSSTLAAENASTTLSSLEQDFRLRKLIHVSLSDLSTSGQDFKLQFARKGNGTCSSPDGSYNDVTGSTDIAYLDNPTPADGDALTATTADPTHSGDAVNDQTYEEANNYTNSQSAIAAGEDGLWDFSLTDNGAPQGNTYCFRSTKSDGTALSTYTYYPQVTIPQRDFNHSAFRFFENKDSTDVGSALASQDTNITLTETGQNFRLRSLFHVSGVDLGTSSQDFQLEFADKSGFNSCADISSGDWAEISSSTNSTNVAYIDNPTPADGDPLTATTADPTHNSDATNTQTYVEQNTFTNGESDIPAGEDGLWDFSLTVSDSAPTSTPYCIRPTKSDGTLFNTYDVYPEITTPSTDLNHSAFRFFENNDGTDVGSALASQDSDITLSTAGENFRLRSLFHVSGLKLGTSSQDFQLEFADKTGYDSCSAVSASDWGEIKTSSSTSDTLGKDWTEVASSTSWTARNHHGTARYNGKLWVLGGNDGSNALGDVWYSTDGKNWTQQGSVPWSARQRIDPIVYDGKMWVVGGRDDNGNGLNDVWYYSSSTDSWTEATSSADWTERWYSQTAVYDGKLWITGGTEGSSGDRLDEAWYTTDGVNWTQQTADAPWEIRAGHTSFSYDNKLWVVGGWDGTQRFDDAWSYSSSTDSWTEDSASSPWAGRSYHGSTAFDDRIWVMGGYDGNNKVGDVWYSSDGANWTEATSSVSWGPRSGIESDVTLYDNKMWVIGGTASSSRVSDVWYSNKISTSTVYYNDNPTPADGDPLTATTADPTHNSDVTNDQTYVEANTFTNSQSAIAAGEDGLWDFSLTVADSAPTSTPYCIRPTKSDGTVFDTYDQYPEVTTYNGSSGSVSCNTSATSTDFGTITSDSVKTASPNATTTVSCTSSNGCELYVKDDGDGSGNPGLYNATDDYLIDSQTETLSTGSEGYGIQAATTTAGSDGTLTLNATYDKSGDSVGGLETADVTLASSTGSVTDREVVVTHKAVISNLTTSGDYADTITYSCVAQ